MKIEYNNLYTHFVFTTYLRKPTIVAKHRERIEKYITGIVNNSGCKLYAIYANPDHMHLLISRAPGLSEDAIAAKVAYSSSKFINDNKLTREFFSWQQSASAFSVSKGDVKRVCKYIQRQPEHHRKHTCQEEYDDFKHFYQKPLIPVGAQKESSRETFDHSKGPGS